LGFPGKFNVIVGNPPYVRTGAIKNYDQCEYEYLKANYDLLHQQFDKSMAFIEFGWKCLASSGYLGVVVPNKWMTNVSGQKFRMRLMETGALHSLVNFRDVQLFPGKTAYVCVLVLGQDPQRAVYYDEPMDLS
jgi:tRNA1(Val) A37 N6-methylase TrmN6